MDGANNPKLNHEPMPMDAEQDPIVEILRLAYRRRLAIRQEREKQARDAEQKSSDIEQGQKPLRQVPNET